jgi:5-methylcytosine-specific restriction endonuclease McrBC regulatory subunit McrC
VKNKLHYIEENLYFHTPQPTTALQIRYSDSSIVKNINMHANKILSNQLVEGTAWRVDFSDVFEKFIQYIFKEAAKETGGRLLTNYRFKGYADKETTWKLKHLEPDAMFQKNELVIFIDAKYKSHLYNKWDNSEILKDEHRNDLHQILGYSSFNTAPTKYAFLCYPSTNVEISSIKYLNPTNKTENKIVILGVPLTVDSIHEAKKLLITKISRIEKERIEHFSYV